MATSLTHLSDEGTDPRAAIEQMVAGFTRRLLEQTEFGKVNTKAATELVAEAIMSARAIENLMCELVASASAERNQRSGRDDVATGAHSIGAAIAERRRLMTRIG